MDPQTARRLISFVVPAWNEERWLPSTLESIRAAASACGRPFEIVVADDASTDRTAEIAQAAGARVVAVAHRQIAATRNSGAKAAAGEYLLFVDADTRVTSDAVGAAIDALDGGAVGGGSAVTFDGRTPLWSRLVLAWVVFTFRHLRLAAGCFLFCRRVDFDAVGGFDTSLFASEEIELSRALGRRGPFVVLRQPVLTSARKLRAYGGREHLGLLFRLALTGKRGVRSRRLLGLWY